MTSDDVRRAVEMCSGRDRRIPLECSGGITLENIRAYAETGVDFISVGALDSIGQSRKHMSFRMSPA